MIKYCLIILIFVSTVMLSDTYHFATHGGGSKKEELLDFKVDDKANSYTLVKYDSNITFGGDHYSNKSKNSLFVKYDKNGNVLMTKDLVAEWPNAMFGAMGVSADGLVVLAARTKAGTIDGHEVYGGNFIGKLGAGGEFEWVLQPIQNIDGARQFISFRVTAIEVTDREIYLAATADGKITLNGFTDPGYAHDNTHSGLLIKMDMAGKVLWIKHIPTPEVDNHPTIDGGMDHILPSKDNQHIYVAGKVGDGSYNPYEVAYVAKFKTDGTFLWVKKTSTSGSDSWGIAETSQGDLISGFGIGGAQLIDFGNGDTLDPSDTGWLGALVRFDKDGNIKTLKYVADAFYSEKSHFGAHHLLRLHHLDVNPNDQVILVGQMVGTHPFIHGVEIKSTPGLTASTRDVAIIKSDLDFNPVEVYAQTGSGNEWGRKCVSLGDKIYHAGEYDSFFHPFLGSYQPQFGDFTFSSAGNQDIYVACLFGSETPVLPGPRLNILRQANTLHLSWPSTTDNASVEVSSALLPDTWDALEIFPILVNEQWQVTLPEPVSDIKGSSFFRLRFQD